MDFGDLWKKFTKFLSICSNYLSHWTRMLSGTSISTTSSGAHCNCRTIAGDDTVEMSFVESCLPLDQDFGRMNLWISEKRLRCLICFFVWNLGLRNRKMYVNADNFAAFASTCPSPLQGLQWRLRGMIANSFHWCIGDSTWIQCDSWFMLSLVKEPIPLAQSPKNVWPSSFPERYQISNKATWGGSKCGASGPQEKLCFFTPSPLIMEVENHPKWKESNIGDIPFSTSMGRKGIQNESLHRLEDVSRCGWLWLWIIV